jgi:proteasome lid subunit RPN8/RPN11
MQNKVKGQVTISVSAKKTLLTDVFKRQRIEACGMLIGSIDEAGNWHVEETYPLRNVFDSPVYFEFDPEDLLKVDLAYPGRVIGAYHSHPTGLARASSTDRQNMRRINADQQIPWVWLIVSGPFDRSPTLIQQVQRQLGLLPCTAVIAYHHYEDVGLRRVSVQFEEETISEMGTVAEEYEDNSMKE